MSVVICADWPWSLRRCAPFPLRFGHVFQFIVHHPGLCHPLEQRIALLSELFEITVVTEIAAEFALGAKLTGIGNDLLDLLQAGEAPGEKSLQAVVFPEPRLRMSTQRLGRTTQTVVSSERISTS